MIIGAQFFLSFFLVSPSLFLPGGGSSVSHAKAQGSSPTVCLGNVAAKWCARPVSSKPEGKFCMFLFKSRSMSDELEERQSNLTA